MIGAIISLVSLAAGAYNQHQMAVKQDKAAAQGIQQQSRLRQEANAALSDRLLKLQQSKPDDAINQKRSGYLDQLSRARLVANQGLQQNSGYSDAFNAYADKTANRENATSTDLADLMARIDGPTAQRQGEGFDTADLGTSFADVARRSQGADFLTKLKVNSTTANPWIDLLSQAGSAYGQGKMSRGFAATKPGGT